MRASEEPRAPDADAAPELEATAAAPPRRPGPAEPPPSTSAYIAGEVKQLILTGELRLGDAVTEKWLTERFDASRPTVREAIGVLIKERYLEQEPYRSARVRSYSETEVRDILEARRLIEGFAADHCEQAADEDRARLRAAFAAYAQEVVADEHESAPLAHVDLHVAIVGMTGNPTLMRLEHELMTGSLLLIDFINWHLQDAEKMYNEHMRLVNAFLLPDAKLARELTDSHLSMVLTAAHERLGPLSMRARRSRLGR